MEKLNFGDAKKQVEEILKIVELCPETLKETCFKLLFDLVFSEASRPRGMAPVSPAPQPLSQAVQPEGNGNRSDAPAGFKLQSNMLAFTRKYGVSMDDLQKLFILDHEPLLPIYKITTKVTRTAQLQKVLMILLENALLNNQFKAPYAELREAVSEVGLMDSNFNKALKKNHELFKGAVTADKIVESQPIELTGSGYEILAQTIKELTQPAS